MSAVLKIDVIADPARAQRGLSKIGGAASKLGKAMAVGLAAGSAAVIAVGVEAVKSASNVEQALGASEKVFGKYSKAVVKRSEEAATALGLSKSGYLDLANVIGTQLKNAGTPMDKLGGKTDSLIQKGADLAAVFGGQTSDAVDALSSLFKGEFDPIEKYGVSIKQSDVNARLAAQGLDKLTGKAAKQAQAQAVLALLNEQTAATTGAFASESDTAAGVQQRLSAVTENLKAKLGAGLLPILVTIGTFILDKIVPGLSSFSAGFSSAVGPAVERISAIFTGKVVPAARRLYTWFVEKIAPGIRRTVSPIIAAARGVFDKLSSAVQRNQPAFQKVLNVVRPVAEFIGGRVLPIVGKLISVFLKLQGHVLAGAIDGFGFLVDKISSLVGWFQQLWQKIQNVAGALKNSAVGKIIGKLGGLFGSGAATITPQQAIASRSAALTAAGPGVGLGGLVPNVDVGGFDVHVYLGSRELTELIDVRVERNDRRSARRLSLMGGSR